DIAHRADAPDPPLERSEGRADLDAEIVEHQAADRLTVDAAGDYHAGNVGHLVSSVAEEGKVHGRQPLAERGARRAVAGEAGLQPLGEDDARAFARRVEHRGG